MKTYKFYKNELGWFIDLKWFPKKYVHHLAMVAGADELLDLEASGKTEITLQVSTKPLLNNWDLLPSGRYGNLDNVGILSRELIFPSFFLGAVYNLYNRQIKKEILKPNQLWLCWVTLLVFGCYPKIIYYKAI